jgi:sugar phosphate permease
VLSRRGPAAALGATGGNKLLYGILFLASILLYRNYFYPGNANTALAHFVSLVVAPAAIGYACAAFVTPPATRRLAKPAWITIMLAVGGLVAGPFGETFSQAMFAVIAFCLNVAGQSIAICATTILQEEVEDAYRGRVFAFYDMMSNATFVAGAGLSALFMPRDGRSSWIIGLVGAGYLVVAIGYWAAARPRRAGAGQPGAGPLPGSSGTLPGAASPSPSAHRSSS